MYTAGGSANAAGGGAPVRVAVGLGDGLAAAVGAPGCCRWRRLEWGLVGWSGMLFDMEGPLACRVVLATGSWVLVRRGVVPFGAIYGWLDLLPVRVADRVPGQLAR